MIETLSHPIRHIGTFDFFLFMIISISALSYIIRSVYKDVIGERKINIALIRIVIKEINLRLISAIMVNIAFCITIYNTIYIYHNPSHIMAEMTAVSTIEIFFCLTVLFYTIYNQKVNNYTLVTITAIILLFGLYIASNEMFFFWCEIMWPTASIMDKVIFSILNISFVIYSVLTMYYISINTFRKLSIK